MGPAKGRSRGRGRRVAVGARPFSLCVALLAAALGGGPRAEAQQATIPNLGTVQGMACPGYANASMFLGVPYATAQRWKPPQLWRHAYTAPYLAATDFPPACPQRAKEQYQLNEDCLFLNIFAPTQNAPGGAPVRIYIHGGWFSQGSASSGAALNDDYLKQACRMVSQTNTIFVTIQYRLGIFGFLSHPTTYEESNTTGNWGIMDQQTAMHWVRNNIRYFGGSSNNITISGGNAGGVSVGIHMVSPRSWPYFTSAVAHNPFPLILDSPSKAYGFTTSLAVGVGCTSPNRKRQLACLRKVDWKVLAQATPPEKAVFEPVNRVFFPVVDGLIIPRQPMELLLDGKMQMVPYTLLLNKHVGRTFVLGSYKDPFAYVTKDYIQGFVSSIYTTPAAADAILAAYPLKNYASTVEQFADIWQDMFVTCPSIDALQLLGKKEAVLKLVSFQQPPTCPNAKSVEGPGDEHELSYILNLDFVINQYCLLSPTERVLAYDVMYTFAQVMANGAPQFANGNQFVGWDEKSEQATIVGPLPSAITQAPMPLVTNCKLFDLPKTKAEPPVAGFPVASPAPAPAPPAPTINCFMKPGKARDLPQAAKESDSQVVADAAPKSVLCYGPGNYQISSPGAKSATRKQGTALAIMFLHATLAGLIALVTIAV